MLSQIPFIFLLHGLISSYTILHVTAAPVQSDIPDALKPRQSEATPHPLDYAPDFSKDPYPPWPEVANPDGSNFTVENWRGTRLFGWKGCDPNAQKIIVETMREFHTLANQEAVWKDIDWDSPAAKEMWGHATEDKKVVLDNVKMQIKQIYEATQQIYDKNWWVPPYIYDPPWVAWRNLWIRVQCSPDGDEANVCGDKPDKPDNCPGGQPPSPGKPTGVEAYSNPLEKYSKITFCNIFFNKLTSLDYVINTAKRNSPAYQNDLWNYQNRARVLFHEMTHLNYFVNAPDSSPYVDDVKIKFGPVKGRKNELCYGPEHVKILANYEAVGKGGFYTQRNADTYAWFAMAKYIEKEVGRYPAEPVVPSSRKPTQAPRGGDGRTFSADDDGSIDPDDSWDLTNDEEHYVPGCEDHPIHSSSTFGATTVNNDASTECPDTNALSGVLYNVFYGQGKTLNIYDHFCQDIDGTVNSKRVVDALGNQRDPAPSGQKLKRTPPPDPKSYDTFNFELSWEKNDATQGCGQTVESCRNAFSRLANSPCGHQGGTQNVLTAAGKITLPNCGSYSYLITGPDVPKPAESDPPATPDLSSDACVECTSTLGASDCSAEDDQCLIDQCKDDTKCQECGIDCNSFGAT